jgi:hypothetical protein
MNSEFTSLNINTVESMLKEVKNNLNKLESLLINIEKSDVFDPYKNRNKK